MPIALLRPRSRPSRSVSPPRRAGRARSIAVGLAGVAIVVSGFVAPVSAARPPTVHPSVSLTTRAGAAVRTPGARVDARAAARLARTEHRKARTAPRLTADVGAARGTTRSRQTTGSTPLAVTPSSEVVASITPRLVAGTTVHQVTTSFPGIEQADTCACEPPDPWIAVSPSHVVQSTNGKIRVSTRAGAQLVSMPSWALFAVPDDRFDADPRIIWDAVHARWVGVITTYNDDASQNGLRLAVSDTSDPTGSWVVFAIETGLYFPDYPGIASSSSKIVLSSDDFDGLDFGGPTLYVIDWSSILGGGVVAVGEYFDGPSRAHFRPAQMLSSGSSVPVIYEGGGGHVGYLDVTQSAAGIDAVTPGAIPTFDLTAAGPKIAAFVAPVTQPTQPGPDAIEDAADERPTDAVYRNGHLWFVATTDSTDGVNHWSAGRWTEVLTTANNTLPTKAKDWLAGSPKHYFTPGVGVSGNGTAFLVASRTDGTEYPSTVAATILPNGVNLGVSQQAFVVIGASTEAYTGARWGDYLGVAADPSYSGAVWVEHELVAAGGGWRTDVARIVSDGTAPSAPGAVSQAISTGTTLTGTVSVKVSWAAAIDAGSGIGSYLVERSDRGGAFVGVTTTSTSLTQPLRVGSGNSVQYRITARDLLGNVGPARLGPLYTPTAYQSNTSATVYSTGWGTSTSSSFYGGSTKYSSTAGKTATFTATNARSIAILSTRGTTRGSFKVYVDNVFKATVNTNATAPHYRTIVYQFAWSTPGTHKVKVVISGSAGHPRVDLDAFVVLR